MEKIKREDFEKWIERCNWFKVNEAGNDKGQQHHYLTPTGEFLIAQYNLNAELEQIIKPMATPIQPKPVGQYPIDFRGGGPFPGIPPR